MLRSSSEIRKHKVLKNFPDALRMGNRRRNLSHIKIRCWNARTYLENAVCMYYIIQMLY